MKSIKSHFEIHSRFRNGIFLLTLFLTGSILIYYFYPKQKTTKRTFVELTEFQNQVDSLKQIANKETKVYSVKPFNPNFISDHKGYQLGLSSEEMDRLSNYRKQGKWINSVSDFKRVTRVPDSVLAKIAPKFKFPEWIENKNSKSKSVRKKNVAKSYDQKQDLNTVTAEELEEKVNIPNFIAQRIIKYRDKIGGFVSDVQLDDITGLYDNQRKKMLSLFTVKTPSKIKKVNINKASVKELIEVPYFDFETALEIREFIEKKGPVKEFNELGKIKGFSLEKIDRIALYLTLK